ncbi:GIY-YIG nuclease family protein [Galbibacter sp. PAP.153]|uniref:GIY-YIG nuclease family protein n=1 Tax=Galbibacter sp. PAP.153 TaxID=3104623 RepID=UPI003007FCC5
MSGFFYNGHLLFILYSQTLDRYYVGASGDLERRLTKHNANHKGYTGRASDWAIVHKERFTSKVEAYRREKQIKGWKSRRMIENLLASGHPD